MVAVSDAAICHFLAATFIRGISGRTITIYPEHDEDVQEAWRREPGRENLDCALDSALVSFSTLASQWCVVVVLIQFCLVRRLMFCWVHSPQVSWIKRFSLSNHSSTLHPLSLSDTPHPALFRFFYLRRLFPSLRSFLRTSIFHI